MRESSSEASNSLYKQRRIETMWNAKSHLWYRRMGVENAMPHSLPNIAEQNGRASLYSEASRQRGIFNVLADNATIHGGLSIKSQ